MSGDTNLRSLIKNMSPEIQTGDYVFSTIPLDYNIKDISSFLMSFKEKESITLIVEKKKADELKLSYDYTASWITLNVHSSLYAVGFLACIAKALANKNISCNVVSGFFHDHIFIEKKHEQIAFETLKRLSLETI